MTADLAAFITERLDETEATARAASADDAPVGDTWRQYDPDRRPGLIEDQHGDWVVYDEGAPNALQAEHIAANDPARTLRAITAKRAILALHETRTKGEGHDGRPRCRTCTAIADGHARRFAAPCPTLCHLGTEWDDHPDYLPEWAPLQ